MMDPALIKLAIPFAVVGLALGLMMARSVTMLSLGDETAAGLGLKVTVVKGLTMLSVVILTGISVAIAGKIAFVGLIIPHITRYLIGQDYRKIIPFSAFLGALFLAACDLISRFVNFPFETPIGVVTALFGVPFFLYLIKTRGAARLEQVLTITETKAVCFLVLVSDHVCTHAVFHVHQPDQRDLRPFSEGCAPYFTAD